MTIREFIRQYCAPDDRLASISYSGTFAAYFLTLWLAVLSLPQLWLTVPLVIVNAWSGVRLYVLQHDLGHGSFFSRRWMNDLAGHAASPFTLTPYRTMQWNHNVHHAYISDLEARETGEIHTMTLKEWQAAPWQVRLGYRIYRNPLFLAVVGGLFVYVIRYRWPKNTLRVGAAGVLAHNAALAAWVALIWALAGTPGLAVYAGTVLVAAVTGVFLVYLQHNFEDTYWDRRPDLSFERAALQGASALDLGWWFDLATGNIAYHDIHHLNARIPSYRLRACHRALRRHFDVPVIRWPEALRSFTLKLWDEEAHRLVPFPPRKQRAPEAGAARAA